MGLWNQSAGPLLLGTLSVAALHALIPSHWLAFAVVGRSQRWKTSQTLRTVALAGLGHVLFTTALGILVAFAGKALWKSIPPQIEHLAAGIVLIALGAYFCFRHHHHATSDHDPHDEKHAEHAGRKMPTTVMGTLAMGMTLSPCLDLLSIYVAASTQPWTLILAVSLLLCSVTLSIMLALVWLTLKGLDKLRMPCLERYEGPLVGGTLILLGLLLFVIK